MRQHIPNILTCFNLLCGCLGIIFCLEERSLPAAYFVWAAAIFDFFDGFAARMLKVNSPIGKELDSLADVVSFGVLPAMVMYKMMTQATQSTWLPYAAFFIAAFSALRLAIFNVDERQRDSFRGLNTPANTLFITSLPLLMFDWLHQEWVLVAITLIFSLLLVSPFEFFAFKFKNFSWSDNKLRFTFIAISVFLVMALKITAVPIIILLYILTSLSGNVVSAQKK